MQNTKANAFKTEELTPKELMFLLFGKKVCPNCGAILKKSKEYLYAKGDDQRVNPGKWQETKNGKIYIPDSKQSMIHPSHTVKYMYWMFSCPSCNRKYRIAELLKGAANDTLEP